MSMFDSSPTTPLIVRADQPLLDQAQLAGAAFLARYNGRTLQSYRADLRQYVQWATRSVSHRWRRHGRLSSSTGHGWRLAAWPRRRSTVGYRPCVATTDSRTSTATSARTPPNTYGGHASTAPRNAAWTAANRRRSCTPPNAPHPSTPTWPSCSASTGSGSARPAAPTSKTSASNAPTAESVRGRCWRGVSDVGPIRLGGVLDNCGHDGVPVGLIDAVAGSVHQ